MGPTPAELDEILAIELEQSRWTWRHPFRRYIHFPARVVIIKWTTWTAIGRDGAYWRYTASQARQMRAALVPILGGYGEPLQGLVDLLLYEPTAGTSDPAQRTTETPDGRGI